MNPIDEQLNTVISMLRASGGQVGMDPNAPDYVKKAFLDMILSCPDCREAIRGKHDGTAN
jgi:hypothetical protein